MKENQELIEYRISRAKETLIEAKKLFDDNLIYGSVNRLYYACFNAVLALLLSKDINAKTHKGVRNQFHLKFILTNEIEKKHSQFFSEIFAQRGESDYDDFAEVDKDVMAEWIEKTSEFISNVEKYLKD